MFSNEFIAGSISGLAEACLTTPLEVIKTRMQINPIKYNNINKTIYSIYKNENIYQFYSGLPIFAFQIIGKNGIRFSSFHIFNTKLKELNLFETEFSKRFMSGISAGFIESLLWTTPNERIKVIQQNNKSLSILNIINNIYKQRGLFGFFGGFESTAIRQMSSISIRFSIFPIIKENINEKISSEKCSTLLAGGFAGGFSALLNHPIDVIKSRQQNSIQKKTILDIVQTIYKKESLFSLYNGILPRTIRIFFAQAICFSVYENVLNYLK